MVITFIELSDQLVIIKDNQNAPQEMAAIQITKVLNSNIIFTKRFKNFLKYQ